MSAGANREGDTALKFDTLDDVAVYKSLSGALEQGSRELRVGLFAYYWGRLSAFPGADDNARAIDAAIRLIEQPNPVEAEALAAESEAVALAVEDQVGKLVAVGYWSVRSYFFKYLGTNEWTWSKYASDSFLSGLDDLAAVQDGAFLHNEMLNLSRGFEAAQDLSEATIARGARAILQWSASSPLGSILPPLPGVA